MVPWFFSWPNRPPGQLRRKSNGNAVDRKSRSIVFMRGPWGDLGRGGELSVKPKFFCADFKTKGSTTGSLRGSSPRFTLIRTRSENLNSSKLPFQLIHRDCRNDNSA